MIGGSCNSYRRIASDFQAPPKGEAVAAPAPSKVSDKWFSLTEGSGIRWTRLLVGNTMQLAGVSASRKSPVKQHFTYGSVPFLLYSTSPDVQPLTENQANTMDRRHRAVASTIEQWVKVMGRGEFEANALRAFYYVASQPRPVPQSSVREFLGLSEAGTSRNMAILGAGASFTMPGPKLIETFEDPDYRRRKLVRLTARGRQTLDSLAAIFDLEGMTDA